MQVIGHLIKDEQTFHAYFHEDAPARELMFFITNHCEEIFKGLLSHVPSAFALPKVGGGTIEAAVVMDIMDITEEKPVLHLILEVVDTDEIDKERLS